MRGLAIQGNYVPHHVAIAGFADGDGAHVLSPPLTTIRQPQYELGSKAAR
jgi:LacI family transcriptional regulator